tara:strand:+ start:50 stop:1072 length:1023 start_codon:yes stop_codon:yes gene_type:complete
VNKKFNVSVLGGGSFGTVLANLSAKNGLDTHLWVRDSELALKINSESANREYHPELKLSKKIFASEVLSECVCNADLIFIATPSSIIQNVIDRIKPHIKEGVVLISCTKGIVNNPTRTITDYIKEQLFDRTALERLGVLSGPNLAREIADEKVAGSVIASRSQHSIDLVINALESKIFKLYSSNDIKGVEYAGALKNIYAIGCGIGYQLNIGENANGLIISRAMAEISQFAVHKGAKPITFLGLAGMGDLIATCTSKLSRNFSVGIEIAQGLSLDDASQKIGQVAEGVNTLKIIYEEALESDLTMPILSSLYKIIHQNEDPKSLLENLINHPDQLDVKFK